MLHGAGRGEARIGGIFAAGGRQADQARTRPSAGDTVALARLEPVRHRRTLSATKGGGGHDAVAKSLTPVYRLAVAAHDRKDEVKLTAAIAKLCEEDPSLVFEQNAETQEMVLAGQGEIHLKVAVERLQNRYGLALDTHARAVPYRETIRKAATARGRHKRQSGGHGQFGDVHAGDRAAAARHRLCLP